MIVNQNPLLLFRAQSLKREQILRQRCIGSKQFIAYSNYVRAVIISIILSKPLRSVSLLWAFCSCAHALQVSHSARLTNSCTPFLPSKCPLSWSINLKTRSVTMESVPFPPKTRNLYSALRLNKRLVRTAEALVFVTAGTLEMGVHHTSRPHDCRTATTSLSSPHRVWHFTWRGFCFSALYFHACANFVGGQCSPNGLRVCVCVPVLSGALLVLALLDCRLKIDRAVSRARSFDRCRQRSRSRSDDTGGRVNGTCCLRDGSARRRWWWWWRWWWTARYLLPILFASLHSAGGEMKTETCKRMFCFARKDSALALSSKRQSFSHRTRLMDFVVVLPSSLQVRFLEVERLPQNRVQSCLLRTFFFIFCCPACPCEPEVFSLKTHSFIDFSFQCWTSWNTSVVIVSLAVIPCDRPEVYAGCVCVCVCTDVQIGLIKTMTLIPVYESAIICEVKKELMLYWKTVWF